MTTECNQAVYCRCYNCDWKERDGTEPSKVIPLYETDHLASRLDANDPVPAGSCPECGCFVYLCNLAMALGDYGAELYSACRRLLASGDRHLDSPTNRQATEDLERVVAAIRQFDTEP
jgi:hypothetical protein